LKYDLEVTIFASFFDFRLGLGTVQTLWSFFSFCYKYKTTYWNTAIYS